MRQVPLSVDVPCSKTRRFSLASVFALTFNAQFGFYLLSPLLILLFFAANSPLFSTSGSAAKRSLAYGLCLSLSTIGSLVANTVIPIISDHYGRKPAWMISMSALLAVALCGLGGLIWQSLAIFMLGFFLHGLLDANKSTGLASVSDASPDHRLVANMGILQGMTAAGACIGPVLGGFLAEKQIGLHTPYSLPFLLTLIIGAMSLGQVFKFQADIPVISSRECLPSPHHIRKFYFDFIRRPAILKLLIILILSQISWSTYYQFIGPFLKTACQFSAYKIGFFMGSVALWLVLAASFGLRLLKRTFTPQQMIRGATYSVAFGTILTLMIGLSAHVPAVQGLLWISGIPIAAGDVIIYSVLVSLLSQTVDSAHRGKAMGLHLIVAMSVWSCTALFGGYLISLNPLGAFYFMPMGIFILLIFSPRLLSSTR